MSKVKEIKKCISNFLITKGYKTIVSPTNNPAPKGKYFSVSHTSVSDYGNKILDRYKEEHEEDTYSDVYQSVMSVVIHEIDGDGDDLRKVKQLIQTNDFQNHVDKWFYNEEENKKYNSFTIQNIESISSLNMLDGSFFVEQSVFQFDVMFNDYINSEFSGNTNSIELYLNQDSLIISEE